MHPVSSTTQLIESKAFSLHKKNVLKWSEDFVIWYIQHLKSAFRTTFNYGNRESWGKIGNLKQMYEFYHLPRFCFF